MAYAPIAPAPNAPPIRINLYSDTQTKPTPAMLGAMMKAEVGDEQHGNDPTVDQLCEKVADVLGKEAAVFLPSGTMCNVIAILVHCRPGHEVVAHETSHILTSEGGAHAALSGVQIMPLKGPRGMFTAQTLSGAIRPLTRHAPEQRLLSLEQTANIGGGAIWPLEELNSVTSIAKENGWAVHMDGARLMNAAVASGVAAREYAAQCDSVWIDFTKGLGAPLGAALAGSRDFVDQAWRWKQRIGGAMRQAGLCAAGCIHALDYHVDRLADDHANADYLAAGLREIEGVAVEKPDTNLVYFDPSEAGISTADLIAELHHRGIHISGLAGRIRACTHLDVDREMIDDALTVIREIVAERK